MFYIFSAVLNDGMNIIVENFSAMHELDYNAVLAVTTPAAFFGIYHMNLIQTVYAGILGAVFAYFLEITGNIWASALLHMAANIWSLIFTEAAPWLLERNLSWILLIYVTLLCIMIAGTVYFQRKHEMRT